MDDLPLENGLGESLNLYKIGLCLGEKFTLLGVRLGVGGIFILIKSSVEPSIVVVGISTDMIWFFWFWQVGGTSNISLTSPTF